MNTLNTRMPTTTRREIAHRFASLGLAAVMTLSILGSVNLLAVEPAADSLLAQHSPLLVSAPAGTPQA
jgi:putative copper export protein